MFQSRTTVSGWKGRIIQTQCGSSFIEIVLYLCLYNQSTLLLLLNQRKERGRVCRCARTGVYVGACVRWRLSLCSCMPLSVCLCVCVSVCVSVCLCFWRVALTSSPVYWVKRTCFIAYFEPAANRTADPWTPLFFVALLLLLSFSFNATDVSRRICWFLHSESSACVLTSIVRSVVYFLLIGANVSLRFHYKKLDIGWFSWYVAFHWALPYYFLVLHWLISEAKPRYGACALRRVLSRLNQRPESFVSLWLID